jgi:hypothetical protein
MEKIQNFEELSNYLENELVITDNGTVVTELSKRELMILCEGWRLKKLNEGILESGGTERS